MTDKPTIYCSMFSIYSADQYDSLYKKACADLVAQITSDGLLADQFDLNCVKMARTSMEHTEYTITAVPNKRYMKLKAFW